MYCMGQKIPVSQKHARNDIISIDLKDAYKNRKDYSLSTIAESIEYIPLETTKECLLANLGDIVLTSNDIIVYVYEDICYRFNRQGKFLNTIGVIGRGPKECTKTRSCVVDTVNSWVYILDWDKFAKYDYEGNHRANFKPGGTIGFRLLMPEPGLILAGSSIFQEAEPDDRYSIHVFSEQQNRYIAKIACEKRDEIPFCIDLPSMYNYGQETYISDFWSDTIYRMDDPINLEAYAVMNKGRFKYRSTDDKSILSGKKNNGDTWVLEVGMMEENDRYIFITTSKGVFFYDKKTKETHCSNYIELTGDKWINFINDITSVPVKSFVKSISTINDNILLSHNEAYEFFETEGDDSPEIRRLKSTLSPDDNPILTLIKLKK